MNKFIPDKIAGLVPYKSEVEEGIKLSANESCYDLPPDIAEEAIKSVRDVLLNRYPDGEAELLCIAYGEHTNTPHSNITPGNGSDELISLIINSFTEEGDKVALLKPDFSMYSIYCQSAGCEVVYLEKDENDEIGCEDIINFVNEQKPKLFIFSNPCNPTGKALDCVDVAHIVSSLDCLVVVDEAYIDFYGRHQSIMPQSIENENCIVLHTLSKAVGLAALRVGFAIASDSLTTALQAARSPYNINSLTQAVAVTVLKHDTYLNNVTQKLIDSKNSLYAAVKPLECDDFKVIDTVTNFILIKSSKIKEYADFLKEHSVHVRYLKGYAVRITAGTDEENDTVVKLTEEWLLKTKG